MFAYAEVINWKNVDKCTPRQENNRGTGVRIVDIIHETSSICSQRLKETHCMCKFQNNELNFVCKLINYCLIN